VRKQTARWTKQDGTQIRVCDMTDSHLLSAMRMLLRYAKSQKLQDDVLYASDPDLSGIAQDVFDDEAEDQWSSPWEYYLHPHYFIMQLDAERRGLQFERHDKIDGDYRSDD